MSNVKVLMYSRPRCGLCDEARAVIEDVRGSTPFEFEEISIEGDDSLELKYGLRIPVVLIDGDEFAEYRLEAAAFERALAE